MLTTYHSLIRLIYVLVFNFLSFCQPYFPLAQSRPLDGDATFAFPMKCHVCLSAAVKELGACETQAKLNIQNCFILVCKDTIDSYRIPKCKNLEYQALHVAAYYGQPQLVGLLLEAGANPWHKNRCNFLMFETMHITMGFCLRPEQTRGTRTGGFRNY